MAIPHSVTALKVKPGSCPHGLPAGACPICSGMGGGGGASNSKKAKSGEMSWDECYSQWQQILRAKAQAAQRKEDQAQVQINLQNKLAATKANFAKNSMTIRIASFAQKISNNLAKPLILASKFAKPVLNFIKNLPQVFGKIANFVQTKFADISDKLTAVFGELKAAINKKFSDKFGKKEKKNKFLLAIFSSTDVTEEEKRVDEAKKLFKLSNIFNTIKEKQKEIIKHAHHSN